MKLILITGPSGSGKTTLSNALTSSEKFTSIVSHTSRTKREGEVEGKDYYYVSEETFLNKLGNGDFIEHVEFTGRYYGVSHEELEKAQNSGKIPVLIVEPHGLRQILTVLSGTKSQVIPIYIGGDPAVLFERFLNRELKGKVLESSTIVPYMSKRLSSMVKEMNDWHREWSGMTLTTLREDDDDIDYYHHSGMIKGLTRNQVHRLDLQEYTPENEEKVLQAILNKIEELKW